MAGKQQNVEVTDRDTSSESEGGNLTVRNRDAGGLFAPGNKIATGRPKGAKNKLTTAFDEALFKDFDAHGDDTIVKVREEQPVRYLELVERRIGRHLGQVQIDTTSGGLIINLMPHAPEGEPIDITPHSDTKSDENEAE